MRKLLENWRKFEASLLKEAKRAVDKRDGPLNKYVQTTELELINDPYPILDWARKNKFVVRQIDQDLFPSFLGEGAQGRVYAVVKGGREYAVKITPAEGYGAENEKKIIEKMRGLRDSLPPEVSRHIAKFYELKNDTFRDKRGDVYNIHLMDILEKLSYSEREVAMGKEVDITGNAFWDDSQWDLSRDLFKDMVEVSFIETLYKEIMSNREIEDVSSEELEDKLVKMSPRLVDAIFKARQLISKKDINKLQNRYDQRGKNIEEISMPFSMLITKALLKVPEVRSMIKDLSRFVKYDLESKFLDFFLDMADEIAKKVFIPNFQLVIANDEAAKKAEMLKPGPEKSFFLAMNKLNKYGIIPNDIHLDNIMKKGNDWVIADIGLFQSKENK